MSRPPSSRGRMPNWQEIARDLISAKATIIFVGTITIVEIVLSFMGGPAAIPEVYEKYGLSRTGMSKGWVWQLITHGFLHGGAFHLIVNIALMLTVGLRLERIGGLVLWCKVITSGILLGGVFHLIFGGGGDHPPILVGASGGAVAGLLWLTGVSPDSRMWPVPLSAKSLGYGMLIAVALLVLLQPSLGIPGLSSLGAELNRLTDGTLFELSHACHLGGALAGWLGARWMLRPRITLEKLQRDRERREGL